jgi:hypothetical protein
MPNYRPQRFQRPPREPRPAQVLWTLRRGGDTQSAQLQELQEFGIELQLLRNGELVYARRHESAVLAAEEAAAYLQQQQADGWLSGRNTSTD